jgi:tetratricopeptide (TPR) repeat protein
VQWVSDSNPDVDAAFITLARQAVVRQPDKESYWRTLAAALLRSSAPAEALNCVDTALTKFPASTELILYRVRALLDLGDYDRALRAVECALASFPAHIGVRILHCDTLTRMKNWKAAAATLEQIAPAASTHRAFFDMKLSILFHESALLELVSLCDSQLARCSGHTSATYYKARVLAKLGLLAEARELLSLDRFVEISSLPTPAGFVSSQYFRDALVAEITRNPTLVRDPRDKATREGHQTRYLRQPDAPCQRINSLGVNITAK